MSVSAAEAAEWRGDLAYFARELPRVHVDPWHSVSRDSFAAAVRALDTRIPGLARHEILVELARLAALVGDGHTSLPLYFSPPVGFHVLPLRLGFYRDTLFVEAADRAYAALVGARVVSIGATPVESALARVAPLISRDRDNPFWILAVAPYLLGRIEVLHALGLTRTLQSVDLTVDVGGRRSTVGVRPLPEPPPPVFGLEYRPRYTASWVDARDASGAPIPLYQQQRGVAWFQYLPETRTMYAQIFSIEAPTPADSPAVVLRRALAAADSAGAERFVLDIRNNTGGEGFQVPLVVRELIRTRYDTTGRMFVIIGRRTFSAAGVLAATLEMWTHALFVGELAGGAPNLFGSHAPVTLPHSGLSIFASPLRIQSGWPWDRRSGVAPRVAAQPAFQDYRTNRDPALAAIYRWGAQPALADLLARAAPLGDRAVEQRIQEWAVDPLNAFIDPRADVNTVACRLLRAGRTREALSVVRSMVRVFPDYANGWDSLGEVLLAAGRRDEGIAAYRRALEIDPDLRSSQQALERLGVKEP
ncbi:MAG: tetratricopeptide repeat protein [Gemmatimonadales bacterium]